MNSNSSSSSPKPLLRGSPPRGPRFHVYRAEDGWRWRLIAGNSRIVATGEAHPSKANAQRAARRLAGVAAEAVRT